MARRSMVALMARTRPHVMAMPESVVTSTGMVMSGLSPWICVGMWTAGCGQTKEQAYEVWKKKRAQKDCARRGKK